MNNYSIDDNGHCEVPAGVTKIEDWAFDGCTRLTGITIPDSVTMIGDWAFDSCTGLTEIKTPSSVTEIGDGAFANCTGLTEITIPSSVTKIGDYAFYRCTSLTKIAIPDGVIEIGDWAFVNCNGLPSVRLGRHVGIKIGLRHWQVDCKCATLDWWASDLGKDFATCNNYTVEEYAEALLKLKAYPTQ